MIKKSLLFGPSTTFFSNPNTSNKAFFLVNLSLKMTERQNQANLEYFNLYLNKTYSKSKIASMRKKVYHKNMMLFISHLQSLVTLKEITLIKTNIAMSFYSPALKWYTSELSDFDYNALNNNLEVKSQINTLLYRFKILTSIALSFLTNKTYLVDDAQACQLPAQYVYIIIKYGIGRNIVNIANKLFFAYQGIVSKQRVYILLFIKTTKVLNFIRILKEKQEVWLEIMTNLNLFNQYISFILQFSLLKLSFSYQNKAFFCYQI